MHQMSSNQNQEKSKNGKENLINSTIEYDDNKDKLGHLKVVPHQYPAIFVRPEYTGSSLGSSRPQINIAHNAHQMTYQSVGMASQQDHDLNKVKLICTNSDDDDETTKNPKSRGFSKSEQKDLRNRRDPRHFQKVATAGPSPMSFGKMIDELGDSDSQGCYDPMGAPSRQKLFAPIENQMAGDQGSDPSQSGGSYSEEPNLALQSMGHSAVNNSQAKQSAQTGGILRGSQDNSAILKRSTNVSSSVTFQKRIHRANTLLTQQSAKVPGVNVINLEKQQSLDQHRAQKNRLNLSVASRPNSEAACSVISHTGELPQHLTRKLPTQQHYACLQSIEFNQHNHLMSSKLLDKLNREDELHHSSPMQGFFCGDKEHEAEDNSDLQTTMKKIATGRHFRINSPVLEQQTMEQCENTLSSCTHANSKPHTSNNRIPNDTATMQYNSNNIMALSTPSQVELTNYAIMRYEDQKDSLLCSSGNESPLRISKSDNVVKECDIASNSVSLQLIDLNNITMGGGGPRLMTNKEESSPNFAKCAQDQIALIQLQDHRNRIQHHDRQDSIACLRQTCPITVHDQRDVMTKKRMFGSDTAGCNSEDNCLLAAIRNKTSQRLLIRDCGADDKQVQEELDEEEVGNSSFCRASNFEEEEGNHIDGLRTKQLQSHQSKRNKGADKFLGKMTTMSQAESYYPENIPRISKLSIFGDPWDTTKDRNKNLIAEIMKGSAQQESEKLREQATIIFNENPNKGIQFCIDSGLFSNRATNIVKFLFYAQGLSKFAIGQYLASPNEMNQQVLKIYASHFEYKGLPIDTAIRKFLFTFRLPGEGDQIQRVIEKFSAAYMSENPEHFDKEDEAFLLAYCLIFLNTLNHNPNVDPKQRLTLDQFLKQCSSGAPRYPRSELEAIYHRICSDQFKTDTQDIERILGRIAPFFHLDPAKPLTKDHDIQMVQRGQMFIKYGRRGQPHARFVYISGDEKYLVWCVKTLQVVSGPPNQPPTPNLGKKQLAQGATTPGRESQVRRIPLKDIIDIKVGISATNVLRKHNLPKELDNVCMSVITSSRTLDLKANDLQTRNKWVQYFYDRVLKEKLAEAEKPTYMQSTDSEAMRKHNQENRYIAYQKACQNDEQQLTEIWVYKIMTNIDAHWDYVKNRPKQRAAQYNQNLAQRMHANKLSSSMTGGSGGSIQRRKQGSFLSCFCCTSGKTSGGNSPANMRIERKNQDTRGLMINYTSPSKLQRTSLVEGLASVQFNRLQSARSDGSLAGSPYLKEFIQNQGLQTSARGESSTHSTGAYSQLDVNLEDLWRFGIPVSIRRVLWPFKIGNKLGISKELYQINKLQGIALKRKVLHNMSSEIDIQSLNEQSQGQSQASQISISNIGTSHNGRILDRQTYNQIREDIDHFFEVTDCLSVVPQGELKRMQESDGELNFEKEDGTSDHEMPQGDESHQLQRKKESLMHLILAFLVYRPDVGYVKNLSFLAGTLLVYCREPKAFICFANFVHEKLFIMLFRGYIQDIKLRIDLFDQYFAEMLPELHSHFEALEIDTAFFLTDWFLTVFVKNIDFRIACRIWDNMILDGEIFAFRTGLAILSYFQSKFLKQCHFQIKEQLSNMRGLVDEHRLFAIIEDQIHIDQNLFQQKCQSQTWGHQKAKLLGFANDYLTEHE